MDGAGFGMMGFAQGGVFSGGNLQKFASGGVVSQPTYFTYDQGSKTGVMGEAGDEAIMPLKRMSNGDLGVQTDGTSGTTFNINIGVTNNGGEDNEQNSREMAQIISDTVEAKVKAVLSDQQRSGGMLSSGVAV